jgi:predicted nucleotidyltransferase
MNDRIQIAKEFAESINSDYIKQIILFGSVARGDDKEFSDIDILIISDNAKEIEDEIIDIAFEIVLDKQEVISPHIASESNLNKIEDFSFMKNIVRDGIVLI